jgi:hypothetical protein
MIIDAFNDLNWAAVAVATIAAYATGLVWFAPPVLGTLWARQVTQYSGIPEADVTSGAAQGTALLRWFVTTAVNIVVLALAVEATGADSVGDGIGLGVVLGVGFSATVSSWPSIFARLPRTWWLLNAGAAVLMNVVAGAILGAWQ